MSLKRLLSGLVGIPLALFLILFAVANRQDVTIGFDPFAPDTPALAVTLPLFAVILMAVMLGVVVGGVSSWAGQGKWRKEAKVKRAEVSRLETETEKARRDAAAARNALVALPAPQKAA